MSKIKNLSQLIDRSSSTRAYFLSLPPSLQMTLHEQHHTIQTAEQLHMTVDTLRRHYRFLKEYSGIIS